jgi:hypothetical protein
LFLIFQPGMTAAFRAWGAAARVTSAGARITRRFVMIELPAV